VRHLYECQLRRADLHGDGNVGNVLYVDYLQEARLDLLRHHDTSPTPQPGEGLVVVRTVIEYLTPLRWEDAPLTVAVWTTEVRAASFTLGYELTTRPDPEAPPVVHARATTVLAPYVFADERPRRLTAQERERLASSVEEAPLVDARGPRPPAWGGGALRRPIHVRFSDVDLLGHVNNVRYLDYLHEASVDLVVGVYREARISGTVQQVVARTEIDYVGQMNLRPEPYDVWCRVADVGTSSVTLEAEIRDGDRVMARARMVEVNLDDEHRPTPMRPEHAALFESRRVDAVVS
jgi:acyl-CoA thioester hydrolase